METQDFTLTKAFACGCHFQEAHLCLVGDELWRKAQDAYAAAQLGRISWDEYSQAQKAYFDHFKELEG